MFRSVRSVISLIVVLVALPAAGISKTTNPVIHSGNLPLAFEPNRGQAQEGVDYVARGNGYSVFLEAAEATIALHQDANKAADVLRVGFSGSRGNTAAIGAAQLPGRGNYIRGQNPQAWIQDVAQFARVQCYSQRSTLPPRITARSGSISVPTIARCTTDPKVRM